MPLALLTSDLRPLTSDFQCYEQPMELPQL
jgi:hypothetical protein